jgi:hypothetical protein
VHPVTFSSKLGYFEVDSNKEEAVSHCCLAEQEKKISSALFQHQNVMRFYWGLIAGTSFEFGSVQVEGNANILQANSHWTPLPDKVISRYVFHK